VQTALLPAQLLEKITDLPESLYRYLEQKVCWYFARISVLPPVAADDRLAHYLGVQQKTPFIDAVQVTAITIFPWNIPVPGALAITTTSPSNSAGQITMKPHDFAR
jgi:GntR family transcriptional regulator